MMCSVCATWNNFQLRDDNLYARVKCMETFSCLTVSLDFYTFNLSLPSAMEMVLYLVKHVSFFFFHCRLYQLQGMPILHGKEESSHFLFVNLLFTAFPQTIWNLFKLNICLLSWLLSETCYSLVSMFSLHIAANSSFELGRGNNISDCRPLPISSLEDVHIVQIPSGGYCSLASTGKLIEMAIVSNL